MDFKKNKAGGSFNLNLITFESIQTECDLNFVIARCIEEAENGHFSQKYLKYEYIDGLKIQIIQSASNGSIPFGESSPRDGVKALIQLIKYQNKKIRFFLLSFFAKD